MIKCGVSALKPGKKRELHPTFYVDGSVFVCQCATVTNSTYKYFRFACLQQFVTRQKLIILCVFFYPQYLYRVKVEFSIVIVTHTTNLRKKRCNNCEWTRKHFEKLHSVFNYHLTENIWIAIESGRQQQKNIQPKKRGVLCVINRILSEPRYNIKKKKEKSNTKLKKKKINSHQIKYHLILKENKKKRQQFDNKVRNRV